MSTVDPFTKLSGFPLILETILGHLDDKDLRNVQQVSKHWNERVNDGNFWRTQLQQKVKSDIVWRQIEKKLPTQIGEGSPCPAKEVFWQIFKSAKQLDRNWRTGRPKVREIKLEDEDDLSNLNGRIKDVLAMDEEKLIAIGLQSGKVKIFNRNEDLKLVKTLFHGEGVQHLKFDLDYLISASDGMAKVWDKTSYKLLETVSLISPSMNSSGKLTKFFCGNGWFVVVNNWGLVVDENYDYNCSKASNMISIWRTIALSDTKAQPKIMELAQRTIVRSGSVVSNVRVNKKYLVAIVARTIITNVDIEVLSTADWSILFTIKGCIATFDEFYLIDNIMIIQLFREDLASQGISPFLFRLIDCDKKSSKDIYSKIEGLVHGWNSNFGIFYGADLSRADLSSGIISKAEIFDSRLIASSQGGTCVPLARLKELCLRKGVEEVRSGFIMDECSIVQYCRFRNATTGVATCNKLVVFDFLERVHPTSGRLNPICREICSNCQKSSSQMKRCSRCRESFYCCAQCQRDDWPVHKLTCGK